VRALVRCETQLLAGLCKSATAVSLLREPQELAVEWLLRGGGGNERVHTSHSTLNLESLAFTQLFDNANRHRLLTAADVATG
jgi:hypothetical protein